jgi:hypothetical protein
MASAALRPLSHGYPTAMLTLGRRVDPGPTASVGIAYRANGTALQPARFPQCGGQVALSRKSLIKLKNPMQKRVGMMCATTGPSTIRSPFRLEEK